MLKPNVLGHTDERQCAEEKAIPSLETSYILLHLPLSQVAQ